KEQASKTADGVHASLQVKSLNPPQFSLRGRPHDFVRILGESSIIQSILVELIDDLKCLENFTIYNKKGSQRDAKIPLPSDILGTRFIVQTLVSEEPTKPMHGKLERMEIALPQLIDLANYSIMTGVKMYGPVTEFSNFCPKCGKKLPHGKNKFCIHCGEKIE
ncbi:MAG: zinc ribbon domain-containing protein, partial [Asgard group archaeon]|nr:zinc ribbon domain-containing protein [Asgard group archaeon]